MQTHSCNRCGKTLSLSNFYIMSSEYFSKKLKTVVKYTYPRTPCKKCIKNDSKNWVKNHHEQWLSSSRKLKYKNKIKLLRIMGGKCVCCGNTEYWNLTMDHIVPTRESGSNRIDLVPLLLDNPSMHSKFQILCYGCNNSKNSHESCKIDHDLKI